MKEKELNEKLTLVVNTMFQIGSSELKSLPHVHAAHESPCRKFMLHIKAPDARSCCTLKSLPHVHAAH